MGTEFLAGADKIFWKWILLMVVQHCDILTATEYTIKIVKIVKIKLTLLKYKFHLVCILHNFKKPKLMQA